MNSFRDSKTNILKAWGCMDSNQDGDICQPEADDFNLEPGKWQLVDGAWQSYTPFDLKAALQRARDMRTPSLNALTGIGLAAQASGDSGTLQSVLIARQGLLDITKQPDVLAATDDATFDHVVVTRYRALAASCPINVQTAFASANT